MEDVKTWLTGERDYTEGVALFCKYGKNPTLKRFFLTKDNEFAKEKLAYELGKLVEDVEPNESEPVEPTIPKVEPKESEPIEPTSLKKKPPIFQDYPEELAKMILERAALTNQKGILANSLGKFAQDDNEGRKDVMDEMNKLRGRINEINDTERFFIKNKKMPEPTDKVEKFDILTAPMPTDKAELLIWKKKLTELRSKSKNKLTKVGEGSPEGRKLAVKIAKINERYEGVEKLLSAGQ